MDTETQAPPTEAAPPAPGPAASPEGGKKRKHGKNRRWKRGEPTPRLNKALSLLQGEMPRVTKTKTAEVKDQQTNRLLYKYDYADLGDVVVDVGPLMAKYGLAFHCQPTINPADRREMILAWALLHESGEERTGEWPLGPTSLKPQSLGSAITYGRRYSFTAATNIVLEDDDDGQRAQQDHGSRPSAGGAWDQASRQRPDRNGQRQQGGAQVDKVADSLAKTAVRIAADPNKTVADLEPIERQIAGKNKLDAAVNDPFGDGLVKARDVLREVRQRMGGQADEPGHGYHEAGDHDGQGGGQPAAELTEAQLTEANWVTAFYARLASTVEDTLGVRRREVGQAVRDRHITPQIASELSVAVNLRAQQLRDQEPGDQQVNEELAEMGEPTATGAEIDAAGAAVADHA